MLFPLVCAALILLVLAAVAMPLLSGADGLPARGQYDRAVYRDQLREIDRDLGRGVLSPEEAEAARLEIQRRLLAVDGTERPAGWRVPARSPGMAIAASLFVVVATCGLYWRLGAPTLADSPFSARPDAAEAQAGHDTATSGNDTAPAAAAPHTDMRQAAEKLQQKLAADPNNAAGWVLYARTTSMLGDWQKAGDAYKHAIDLGQKDADVYAGYGEMQVMAADGIVPPAARETFQAALAADAANGVARYYLALADSQAGDEHKAVDAWLELSAGLPEDSPMRDEIAHRIADAAKSGGFDAPPLPKGLPAEARAAGDPTQDQMEAAANMSPDDRAKMIGGMIEQLAAKLKEQPNDLDGWLRLARAYEVQGDSTKAVDALDHAAALKPGDPGIKLQTVSALLSGLKPEDSLPPRAVAMLTEIAAVTPDAPEVLWYLGVVAARDGRPADAREKWTKLLGTLAPGGEDAKMVQSALAQLPAK
jgi:cytochrome c-type biogenesis protein CcmH